MLAGGRVAGELALLCHTFIICITHLLRLCSCLCWALPYSPQAKRVQCSGMTQNGCPGWPAGSALDIRQAKRWHANQANSENSFKHQDNPTRRLFSAPFRHLDGSCHSQVQVDLYILLDTSS